LVKPTRFSLLVEKSVVLQLFPVFSFLNVKFQARAQKFNALDRQLNIFWNLVCPRLQVFLEVLHIFTRENMLPGEYLKQEGSQAPHISFEVVFLFKNLRCHLQRRSSKSIVEAIL
jgi:hypothetical protein